MQAIGIAPVRDSSFDAEDFLKNAEARAAKNKFLSLFYSVVTSVTFNFLIYCFILANTITLALYRFDQSDEQEAVLKQLDILFIWVFAAEMLLKLVGLGFRSYARDRFNLFDAVIVIISLVDFALSFSGEMAD